MDLSAKRATKIKGSTVEPLILVALQYILMFILQRTVLMCDCHVTINALLLLLLLNSRNDEANEILHKRKKQHYSAWRSHTEHLKRAKPSGDCRPGLDSLHGKLTALLITSESADPFQEPHRRSQPHVPRPYRPPALDIRSVTRAS